MDTGDIIQILLGGAVGTILGYFSSQRVEANKRKADKQDELKKVTREAIEGAMKWLSPIRNAMIAAEVTVYRGEPLGKYDGDLLIANLSKLDLPEQLIALLPAGASYREVHKITRQINEISVPGYGAMTNEQRINRYEVLKVEVEKIHEVLQKAYLGTFD